MHLSAGLRAGTSMDFKQIIECAFKHTKSHRFLWVFGFLVALCPVAGQVVGQLPNLFSYTSDFQELFFRPAGIASAGFTPQQAALAIFLGIIYFCLWPLITVSGLLLKNIGRTAVIGLVNRFEDGMPVSVRIGWEIGWSKRAWRIFWIMFVVNVPVALLTAFLLGLALSPFFIAIFTQNKGLLIIASLITALGVGLVWFFLTIIKIFLHPFVEIAWRYTTLNLNGVFASLGQSYALIRRATKSVAIGTILNIGFSIAWGIILGIVLIPVASVGALLGGIPASITYWLTGDVVAALIATTPLLIITLIMGIAFAKGLYLIFESTFWTLIFRRLTKRTNLLLLPDHTLSPATSFSVEDDAVVEASFFEPGLEVESSFVEPES